MRSLRISILLMSICLVVPGEMVQPMPASLWVGAGEKGGEGEGRGEKGRRGGDKGRKEVRGKKEGKRRRERGEEGGEKEKRGKSREKVSKGQIRN